MGEGHNNNNNNNNTMKISELKPSEEFYFLNLSLPGGINNLTRFRRTPKGYTNLVTGENTQLSSPYASSSEVVKAIDAHLEHEKVTEDSVQKDQDQVGAMMSLQSKQHFISLPEPMDLTEDDLDFAEGRFAQWVVSNHPRK